MKILVSATHVIDLSSLADGYVKIQNNGENIEIIYNEHECEERSKIVEKEESKNVKESKSKRRSITRLTQAQAEDIVKQYLGPCYTFKPFKYKAVANTGDIEILDLNGNFIRKRSFSKIYTHMRVKEFRKNKSQVSLKTRIPHSRKTLNQAQAEEIVKKYLDGRYNFKPFVYKSILTTGLVEITDLYGNTIECKNFKTIYATYIQNRSIGKVLFQRNINACKSLNDMFKGFFIIKTLDPDTKFSQNSLFEVYTDSNKKVGNFTYKELLKTKNTLLSADIPLI